MILTINLMGQAIMIVMGLELTSEEMQNPKKLTKCF